MKTINSLFIIISGVILVLIMAYPEVGTMSAVFIFTYLGLIFLLALSSRSLSYIFYNNNRKIAFVVIIDFIGKILIISLLPVYYFSVNIIIFIISTIVLFILIICCLSTRKELIVNITLPSVDLSKSGRKLSIISLTNFFLYVLTISFFWFPDYTISNNYYFIIPLVISLIGLISGMFCFKIGRAHV